VHTCWYRYLELIPKAIASVREDLINGKGFTLFRGFSTAEWPIEKVATAYMGLGSHIGEFVSQNGKGHVLVEFSYLYLSVFAKLPTRDM